jgi:hypothetical protein
VRPPSQKIAGCGGMHHHLSYSGSINRRIPVQAGPGINVKHCLKNNWAGGIAEVAEHLPNKFKPQYCKKCVCRAGGWI